MADSRRLLLKDASEIETVAENHLRKQVIRGARHAHTQPKIDFPLGREVQVNRGKNLLLLLAYRVKARDRAERAVILEASRDFLGEIVAELEVGRENETLIHTRAMEGSVKRGIERKIPRAELLIDNGPDFPRPGVRGVSAALPADFVREADADGPVPVGRNAHPGTNVAAYIIPTLAVLGGSKNVKPGLEPVVKTVGDLDGFMQLVVRGKSAVIGGFGALKCKVRVQLHHSVARLDSLVRIHLDFVVPLRASGQRQGRASKRT